MGEEVGANFGFGKVELPVNFFVGSSVLRGLLFNSVSVIGAVVARELLSGIRPDSTVAPLVEERLSFGLIGLANSLAGLVLGGGASPASPLEFVLGEADRFKEGLFCALPSVFGPAKSFAGPNELSPNGLFLGRFVFWLADFLSSGVWVWLLV